MSGYRSLAAFAALMFTVPAGVSPIKAEPASKGSAPQTASVKVKKPRVSQTTLVARIDLTNQRMSVSYGGSCPEIRLRGTRSLFGSNTPSIYVDGARALDACVLDELAASIVERIEVYPSGVARRPGYDSDRNGLILVFVLYGTEC